MNKLVLQKYLVLEFANTWVGIDQLYFPGFILSQEFLGR